MSFKMLYALFSGDWLAMLPTNTYFMLKMLFGGTSGSNIFTGTNGSNTLATLLPLMLTMGGTGRRSYRRTYRPRTVVINRRYGRYR